MAEIRLYLVEIEKDKAAAQLIVERTAKRLETKELKLADLIVSLGEFLNNDKPITRERAISFLADVITATPNGVFPLQHRKLLLDFITSRLTDQEVGIGSAARALLALEERGRWDTEQVAEVIKALMEGTPQLLHRGSMNQRYPVFLLIDRLMANYRQAMLNIHETDREFLRRFCEYFEGEKDPRNLMVLFSIMLVISTEWDISACVQEVFDTFFNYFPITFRPPPDDPYQITANDLKDRLKACIGATPAFAPYAFSGLLEKLDSFGLNTKRDVLKALQEVARNYGPKTMAVYSVNLWDSLKFEILQAQEEELAEESLLVLMEIGKALMKGEEQALMTFLKPIIKESNEHLEDAPTKQSEATTRILTAVASISAVVCNQIILDVFPLIFRLFQGTESTQKKRSLTQVFQNILKINCEIFGDWNGDLPDSTLPENALKRHSKPLLGYLKDNLIGTPIKEVSFRLALLDTSLQLSKIRDILSDEEIAQIVKLFTAIIVDEESYTKDDAKVAAMSALLDIAHQKSQIVVDTTFPVLLARLPDTDVGYSEKYVPILEAFAKISVEERVFTTSLVRLKNRLASAVQHQASAEYLHAILSAILYVFQHIQPRLLVGTASPGVYHDLVLPMLTQIYPSLSPNQRDGLTYTLIGKIANEVIRLQPVDFQIDFAPKIYTIPGASSKSEDCAPFSSNHDEHSTRSLLISLYLLAAMRPEINPFPFNPASLLSALVSVISSPESSMSTKAAALLQISLVVNKFIPAASLKEIVTNFMESHVIRPGEALSLDSIRICFAILKGIQLHRSAPLVRSIFPTLLSALSDPKIGRYTAQGFSTLLQPEEVLSKENHCVLWALYKQRTFSIVVPAIIDGFRKASADTKPNHLVALSGILQWLDYSAFESEVSSITPLLLQTLDISGEHEIKTGAIDKITEILKENPNIVEEHASSFITRLLNLANPKGKHGAPATVRAKALQCLSLLAEKMRMEIAIPFQKQVIKRLLDCLDDGRRVVRTEAVRCRTKWIELEDVGEEED